ncbi:unnamed protein product [Penicillium glandicola]
MTRAAPDSVYARDRTYFLNLLQRQVMDLRSGPSLRPLVIERLRELSQMIPGCIEASHIPIFHIVIAILCQDDDPIRGYIVADQLERAIPVEIRDPTGHLAKWQS